MARQIFENSVFRRSPVCALVVTMGLVAAPYANPNAWAQGRDQDQVRSTGQAKSPAKARELIIVAPRLTRRCRLLELDSRPTDVAELEARVIAWMATCVTSRSGEARRELALVRGNRSLAALWAALPVKATRIRLIPTYTWDGESVIRVDFTSPDVPRSTSAPGPATAPGAGNEDKATALSSSPSLPSLPSPAGSPSHDAPYPATQPPAPPVDRILPDAGKDILLDVAALIERMRERGQSEDADKLERLAGKAAKLMVSLGILVGAYYVATEFRAGKLLFMWGAGAMGPQFERALGRMARLLPEVESSLDQVVNAARPHVSTAGAGLDWRVLDQIVDPSIPAQLDNAACGPACAQMVLRDRELEFPQSELVARARAMLPAGIESKFLGGGTMHALVHELDPAGNWGGGRLRGESLRGKTWRQLLEKFGAKGSWIAQVGRHFVVVDRFDSRTGSLFIRDPWYEPARERGIVAGTHYRVSVDTFFNHWVGVAIFRE